MPLLPPNAPPRPAELDAALEAKLTSLGAGYQPRTRHLEGTRPQFVNRLLLETSPYLQQHAHNPVDWRPWSAESFAEAKRLGRPVLLSVGYSTCHWCHVMEHESFEDVEIASFINANYIAIKVDREERPDVDAIYMTAVQQLNGSGGWPMTVWLTAAQEPFFAGTYYPPREGERGSRYGFLTLLRELHRMFVSTPARVGEAATQLTAGIREHLQSVLEPEPTLAAEKVIPAVVKHYEGAFDPNYGGLRSAPKFPSNVPLRLLMRHHVRTGEPRARQMVEVTLEKMAGGGIYDQLAGGFHRYSTDRLWRVPHFEKMLYDNALLAVVYAEAVQLTGRSDFARIAGETLDYLSREMTAAGGGLYSATDADSEGEEGLFCVWEERQVRELLGAEAERFIAYYGVSGEGDLEGRHVLHADDPDEDEWAALAPARATLLASRLQREQPLRDEKILAAWNGLAISAFSWGGRVLRSERHLESARRAARFVLDHMRVGTQLRRSMRDGQLSPQGFLDDAAFVIQGLLDLYESTFELTWLDEALALAAGVEEQFADPEHGGWFLTAREHEALLAREKPNHDGAEPSGSSVQTLNVLRLAALTDDRKWRDIGVKALRYYAPMLVERPLALTEMLLALDFATHPAREIVLVTPEGTRVAEAFAEVLATAFIPSRVIVGASGSEALAQLAKRVPLAADKVCLGGKPTAYVCEEGACQLPTTDFAVLRGQLSPTAKGAGVDKGPGPV